MGILKSTVQGVFNSAKAIVGGTADGLNKTLEGLIDGYEEIKSIPSAAKLDRRKKLSGIYEIDFEQGTAVVEYFGSDNSWELRELSWDLEDEARQMGWKKDEATVKKTMRRLSIDQYFVDLTRKNKCLVDGPHWYPLGKWD